MRTLQEKYNGVLADKFSKAQFKRDAIMECSHLVSHFNSFDDVVNILKNRGVIAEAKKEEPKYSTASAADHIAPDVLDTGIKFECDKKHGTLDVSEEEYNKCREAAIKNLTKDVLYYVKQDSEQLPTPGDQMEKVTLKEEATGDLSDVMLRAQEYAASKYPELDSDDIGDFLQLHGQEILDGDDLETSFDNYVDHNFPMNEESRYKVRLTTPHGDSAFVLGGKEMSSDEADLFIKRATNVAGMSKLEKVALEEETYTAQDGNEYKASYNLYVKGEKVANFEDKEKAQEELKKYQDKYGDRSDIVIKPAHDAVEEVVNEGEWEDKGQSKELNKKRLEDLKAKRAKGGPKGAIAVMDKEIAQLEKLVNEGDIKLSAEDMEKLHKDGKITLPDGSVLHFIGKADEEVDATEKAASDKIGRGEEFTDDDAAAVADKMPKIKKGTEFKLIGEDEPDAEDLYQNDDEYLATLKQRKALKEAVKGIIRNVLQS